MNYEQLAKSILAKSLNIPENDIKSTHTINDLKDIDSVEFAILVATIEKYTKTPIPIEDLLTIDTVHQIAKILEKNT